MFLSDESPVLLTQNNWYWALLITNHMEVPPNANKQSSSDTSIELNCDTIYPEIASDSTG